MVLAQRKIADNYINSLPKKRNTIDKGKKVKSSKKAGKLLAVSIILLVFSLGIVLTIQYAKIATASFQVVKLKEEIAALETANQRTYLELLQFQSLDRIEQLATTQLGMVYAQPMEKQLLAVNKELSSEPWYVTENYRIDNTILIEQEGKHLNPIIQAISQIIKVKN